MLKGSEASRKKSNNRNNRQLIGCGPSFKTKNSIHHVVSPFQSNLILMFISAIFYFTHREFNSISVCLYFMKQCSRAKSGSFHVSMCDRYYKPCWEKKEVQHNLFQITCLLKRLFEQWIQPVHLQIAVIIRAMYILSLKENMLICKFKGCTLSCIFARDEHIVMSKLIGKSEKLRYGNIVVC